MMDVCRYPNCQTRQAPMDAYGSRLCLHHGMEANDELDSKRPPGEMLGWEQACGIVRQWLERKRGLKAVGG